MSDRPVPIWPLAGLDQMTYKHLPWPKKRILIIRYQGLPVFEFNNRAFWKCPCCGFQIDHVQYTLAGRGCPVGNTPVRDFKFQTRRDHDRTIDARFVPDCYPHSIVKFKKPIPRGWYLNPIFSKN